MSSPGNNATAVQDKYLISLVDCCKPVRYNQGGQPVAPLQHKKLDYPVEFRIEGAGWFVEDEDVGVEASACTMDRRCRGLQLNPEKL